jgi:RNA-directed DNA polymerase
VHRVAVAIVQGKTHVIDIDLRAYFDSVRHHKLLEKVARRVNDDEVMRLLKKILTMAGQCGVPQGGVLSPLLSNLYLNEVDKMLEKAREVTRERQWTRVEYARYADDLVILVQPHHSVPWLQGAVVRRLREELSKLDVEVNEEKSRTVDLTKGEGFGFLGFEYRRVRSRRNKWRAWYVPKLKKRTALLRELREAFRRWISQPVNRVIQNINPILRGWVNYFRVGNSSRCFGHVRRWVEEKVRRHMMRNKGRKGFGWKRWSSRWLYETLGLFKDYQVVYYRPSAKALPAR